MITVHAIVRNEDQFIDSALRSVLSSKDVTRVLIWDTGSTDSTVEKVLSIHDPRIDFQKRVSVTRTQLVALRNEQIRLTTTSWFLLVDGDEVWPKNQLKKLSTAMKKCNHETIALVCRTRNVVGDLRHYLPNSEGKYKIGPWAGHLNIRAVRNLPGLAVKGEYPNEWYELDGKKIQDQPGRLQFVDSWYLHATHLRRSSSWVSEAATTDRLKKHKWFYKLRRKKLLAMPKKELPEALKK